MAAEIVRPVDETCGPHCGHKDKVTRHCSRCHTRECTASHYDRSKIRPV